MKSEEYNRQAAIEYAEKWAFGRNPDYMSFDGIGGDCTNFVSQCIFAGSGVMNYTKDTGWYYKSPDDRAAAWSSAEFLNKFLLNNKSAGPHAKTTPIASLLNGDIIQLHNGMRFYHTLIVVGFSAGIPLVAAHTDDSNMRPLSTYYYVSAQGLHITETYK